jgi:PIN domain nuclease of toxin-antitoxin system
VAGDGMSLLLDAHVLIWLYLDPDRLPRKILNAIRDVSNQKAVSAVTIWEIAIKRSAGRLGVPGEFADRVLQSGFRPLPIAFQHAEAAGALPSHHGDPFDRMLVAQAQAEGLTIVTADPKIQRYAVTVLPAS